MATDLLLAIACLVPAVAAGRACITRRGLVVDHVLLFSTGFLLYWMLPVVLVRTRVFATAPGLRVWFAYVDAAVAPERLVPFLVAALLIYLGFLGGARAGARIPAGGAGRASQLLPFDPRLLGFLFPVAAGLAALFAWQLRSQLFAGYSQFEVSDNSARGPLSAASLVLLALLLLQRAYAAGAPHRGRLAGHAYAAAYCATAVLLLSAGGRLYVASAALIWFAFYTGRGAVIPMRRALFILVVALLASAAVGVLRSGGGLSLLGLAANVFSEPLFTSFSMFDFVGRGELPLWNVPRFLLGDLVNLVPSALFPGKGALLVRPEDYGYVVYAPVGAVSAFFSLMINFGLLGSIVAMFALGFALSFARRSPAPLLRVVYAMLAGWLGLAFYRDPFSITLVKNMLEFSLIVPVAVAMALHVATVAARPALRPRGLGRPVGGTLS